MPSKSGAVIDAQMQGRHWLCLARKMKHNNLPANTGAQVSPGSPAGIPLDQN
jgi:hypothetical protein